MDTPLQPLVTRRAAIVAIVLAASALLAAATTYAQVNYLGMHFLRVQQQKVHVQMLAGTAGNPWQYRILADALLEPAIRLFKGSGVPQPESFTFIGFRFLQCWLILGLAAGYYRRLGLWLYESLIGLAVLAWSMSLSLYNSDLSFNVFFDIAFYLLAGSLILARKYAWIVVLMVPAALNRETSILIPLLAGLAGWKERREDRRAALIAAGLGLLVYGVIFAGLRIYYGPQPFLTADGYSPGPGLLLLNVQRGATWEQLAITLSIIPLVALLQYRAWPPMLRLFFWAVVPVWVAVHFLAALVAEARLLLVPQALVLIPGALSELTAARQPAASQTEAGS